jgi:hypothetical protein
MASTEARAMRMARVRPIVTVSLDGFSAGKREGIELSTSFAATVNPELCVGTINETSR